MYKGANDKAQDAARRLRLSDICSRDFDPTDEERRENLKLKCAAIEKEILSLPPKSARRVELGLEKFQIQQEMSLIRKRWKGPDLSDCLLKVIKSQVTKHQWASWVKMAEEFKADADALATESNLESC